MDGNQQASPIHLDGHVDDICVQTSKETFQLWHGIGAVRTMSDDSVQTVMRTRRGADTFPGLRVDTWLLCARDKSRLMHVFPDLLVHAYLFDTGALLMPPTRSTTVG